MLTDDNVGTVAIGGDLEVRRLGYGTIHITSLVPDPLHICAKTVRAAQVKLDDTEFGLLWQS